MLKTWYTGYGPTIIRIITHMLHGIFTYIWVIVRANVGKYSIHGECGFGFPDFLITGFIPCNSWGDDSPRTYGNIDM